MFSSIANDIVAPDDNNVFDVFRRDLRSGTTVRVSIDAGGGDPDGSTTGAVVSGDGRYIAFQSDASDLVAGDATGGLNVSDVFVRDMETGTTTRVSIATGGGDPDEASFAAAMSADGNVVAFASRASHLVASDGNGESDVFVRNLQTATTTRVSLDTSGNHADERRHRE